jgi:hypothetical protein
MLSGGCPSWIVKNTFSLGKGVMPFPPGSPSCSFPLVRVPEVMKFFIMPHSLSLSLC